MAEVQKAGSCGTCATGGRRRKTSKSGGRRHRRRTHRGGSMLGDALLAAGALGLYSYFVKKRK
jgi:nitroreductase